jgi:hypothetical protein
VKEFKQEGNMFKTTPVVLEETEDYIIDEIHCPINDDHCIEPIPTFNNLWSCCDCGMDFEVTDEI